MNEYLVSYKMANGKTAQETVQICGMEAVEYSVSFCAAMQLDICESSIVKVKRIGFTPYTEFN